MTCPTRSGWAARFRRFRVVEDHRIDRGGGVVIADCEDVDVEDGDEALWAYPALVKVSKRRDDLLATWCPRLSVAELVQRLQALASEEEHIRRVDLAPRGARTWPTLRQIAAHHGLGPEPYCLRCGWQPPVETWVAARGLLERAHIIDRVFDGLDLVSNIAPLCAPCHRAQPIFGPRDEYDARAWFGLPLTP